MRTESLVPHLPLYDDELTQGYLVRNGYFQAGVRPTTFCGYAGIRSTDFYDGSENFIYRMSELTGSRLETIASNTLTAITDDKLKLRGERFSTFFVFRTKLRFCAHCLAEDKSTRNNCDDVGPRLRWYWLLHPVVVCRQHSAPLLEFPISHRANAYDLSRVINAKILTDPNPAKRLDSGLLQNYAEDRMWGKKDAAEWLDSQSISAATKACEMLGALLDGGPNAPIGSYTALDWARVSDIGFKVCANGPGEILNMLRDLRIGSGRRSGTAGPQAAYGFLFNSLKYSAWTVDFGPLRTLVREAILDNFSIAPGEMLLGEKVLCRRMHSVSSLAATTGYSRARLYRLMRKSKIIPDAENEARFHQFVFPADKGERFIDRLRNSVPLSRVHYVLGCSEKQAALLAQHKLITSIKQESDRASELSTWHFNRDDLESFLNDVTSRAAMGASNDDEFCDLLSLSRAKISITRVIHWLLSGGLTGTLLVGGAKRLDALRFNKDALRDLIASVRARRLHSLSAVALRLGVQSITVKKLIFSNTGKPKLAVASADDCFGLSGSAYVTDYELMKFMDQFATLAVISRTLGIHSRTVRRALQDRGVNPAFDPKIFSATIYRRTEVNDFVYQFSQTGHPHERSRPQLNR